LYNWSTALKACPVGWHLPSDAEWTELENAVGGSKTAGTKLKSTAGWYNDGNGTDKYGFTALPGGYKTVFINPIGGDCQGCLGHYGEWWSAKQGGSAFALIRGMYYSSENVSSGTSPFNSLLSVRCVLDSEGSALAAGQVNDDKRFVGGAWMRENGDDFYTFDADGTFNDGSGCSFNCMGGTYSVSGSTLVLAYPRYESEMGSCEGETYKATYKFSDDGKTLILDFGGKARTYKYAENTPC